MLLEVNRRVLELTELAADDGLAARRRVNFGVYVLGDEEHPDGGVP